MRTRFLATILVAITTLSAGVSASAQSIRFPYQDTTLCIDKRVDDLIARMTLEEKVSQMEHESPAIERLGISAYNWWNEALHGVARTSEKVTSFPQAIGMAASFDTEVFRRVADATSSEGRAIFNDDIKKGLAHIRYRGLTYWTPNVNIFRDPRWGRGQETYGEDPYLTATMGLAMVRGLEGNDPKFLKAVACAKHFAVHSGPEHNRHSFNATASTYDLWDTYLPAFKELVTVGNVHGMMCAYNRFEGQPCCGNDELMMDILRNQWRFDGYVTSDCWGINDFTQYHKTHPDVPTAVADAVLTGTDLECGGSYGQLITAVEKGLLEERHINQSVRRLFEIRFKLGMFDPLENNPYGNIGLDVIECNAHKQLALEISRKSMVLLENKKNTLPLSNKVKRILVVGPNADNENVMLSNYFGTPSNIVSALEGIKGEFQNAEINYIKGVDHVSMLKGKTNFDDVVSAARKANIVIFVGGISADYEGEAGDAGADGFGGFASGDRTTINLPEVQTNCMKAIKSTKRPLIFVNMSGSAMTMNWETENADAIIQAWYGGQAGGTAIAEVISGRYNPAGRMPVTVYKSDADLPHFEDYSMRNRTYRYFKGDVSYTFGYGLSYTKFEYQNIKAVNTVNTGENIIVTAEVSNKGELDGDEVVQLYITHPYKRNAPIRALKGFKRVNIKVGETKLIEFTLRPQELALTDQKGNLIESAGSVGIHIGGGQPNVSQNVGTFIEVVGDDYMIL